MTAQELIANGGCKPDDLYIMSGESPMSLRKKKNKALDIALRCSQIDGAHHKLWVIDQMVRALTGCPAVTKTAKDYKGEAYEYQTQGESDEYKELIEEYCEDGAYEWEVGSPP